ncbi:unnamed protein product [Urochloa decumbens]|uniref:Uncharacterized protein n=1 Tax=Urochloa decumbens TaxID=240449 RepID=A0ABC9GK95_9POAL
MPASALLPSTAGLFSLHPPQIETNFHSCAGNYRTSSSDSEGATSNSKLGRRGDGGQVPAPGGEGGRRDGVHAGDRPRHRRAPRPGGRRRRHLLPEAVGLQKNVDEAVERLKAKGITVVGAVCHVSDAQQRKGLIDTAVKNFGHIDILVSNAAANPTVDGILEMKEAVLDKLWDINVKASILLLQDAAPHLRKGSSVIIISSITGYNPEQGLAMYGVTKTALLGLTKALAAEMGPNTRVNCIAPGFVPTRFASFLTTNETIRKELTDKITLNRLGSVEDMAAAAAFLASDDASFITAETIVVAGGMQSRL